MMKNEANIETARKMLADVNVYRYKRNSPIR